ncbi:MAG TPA: hypothetical protein VL860_00425, partial [Planctomycetota bacterium]|nr:hypothetical protein [Planctomycetota bacterium]
KTGDDITVQLLAQIILELDKTKLDSFPVPLLVRIIRMNDQLVKDFIEKYFNQALQSFLEYQRRVEEQIRQTHGLPSALPLVSAWTKAVLEPFSSALRGGGSAPAQAASQPPQSEQMEKLRQTVQELQAQLSQLKTAGTPPAPRKRRRAKRR